jgi:hypothetical protein
MHDTNFVQPGLLIFIFEFHFKRYPSLLLLSVSLSFLSFLSLPLSLSLSHVSSFPVTLFPSAFFYLTHSHHSFLLPPSFRGRQAGGYLTWTPVNWMLMTASPDVFVGVVAQLGGKNDHFLDTLLTAAVCVICYTGAHVFLTSCYNYFNLGGSRNYFLLLCL